MVVLHPLSTSNHNPLCNVCSSLLVVLHPLSTSNHNGGSSSCRQGALYCILFLHQTTTYYADEKKAWELYCILFLHQTTTDAQYTASREGCIASSFYIKPQLKYIVSLTAHSCIASSFYIKPQLRVFAKLLRTGCIASSFYIKPQPNERRLYQASVVLHPLSTSNHNLGRQTL